MKSVRIRSFLIRVQSESGKIRTGKTRNTDTFHAMIIIQANVCEKAGLPTKRGWFITAFRLRILKYRSEVSSRKQLKPEIPLKMERIFKSKSNYVNQILKIDCNGFIQQSSWKDRLLYNTV